MLLHHSKTSGTRAACNTSEAHSTVDDQNQVTCKHCLALIDLAAEKAKRTCTECGGPIRNYSQPTSRGCHLNECLEY